MAASTTLHNWGCFVSVIFIDSIHAIKPLIYKFPLTLHSTLLLFFPSRQCVLRYTALFIKGAEPNELLTGARLSISSLKECSIISRLLAFFSFGDAIYSSGFDVCPLAHSPSLHLHLVRRESRAVSSAMPVYLDSADPVWVKAGYEAMINGPCDD